MVMRSMPHRRGLLGALLLVTLALAVWATSIADRDVEVVAAVVRPDTGRTSSPVSRQPLPQLAAVALDMPEREPITPGSAFGIQSWFVPPPRPSQLPPQPQAVPAPPRPSAPPLPYTFIGTITLGDGIEVLHFMRGVELRVARLGDTLDDHYRLDDMDRHAIVFTYLPLSQRQYLALDKD